MGVISLDGHGGDSLNLQQLDVGGYGWCQENVWTGMCEIAPHGLAALNRITDPHPLFPHHVGLRAVTGDMGMGTQHSHAVAESDVL